MMFSFKRRGLWLVLPLVLGVLAWGLKWRADNPSSTKEDLEIRALMLKTSRGSFFYHPHSSKSATITTFGVKLSEKELEPFVQNLHLLQTDRRGLPFGKSGTIELYWFLQLSTKKGSTQLRCLLDADGRDGIFTIDASEPRSRTYNLHPTTTKRWLELLLNHPRIGPELRRRMQR